MEKKIRAFKGARSYKVRALIVSRLVDLFRTAQLIQMPHATLSDRVNFLTYNSPEYSRLLNADKAYIQGYRDALQRVHEQALLWMMFLDGKYCTRAEIDSIVRQEEVLPCARENGYRSPWNRVIGEKGVYVYRDIHGDPMRDKHY